MRLQDPVRRHRACRDGDCIACLVAGQAEGHDDHGHRADDDRQSLRRTPRRRSIRSGATPTAASAATTTRTSKLVGILAEKWEAIDPTTWRFTLRKGLKRHDGGPGPTSADVVHTLKRIRTDPESVQSSFVAMVAEIVPVDDHTFDVKTKGPAVNLVMALFDRFIITSAELYAKYGREADKKHAFGWGPYQLVEYQADRRVVMRKNPDWTEIDGSDTKAHPTS